MIDRHVKQWNMEEQSTSGFEDGCGCVSVGVKYGLFPGGKVPKEAPQGDPPKRD